MITFDEFKYYCDNMFDYLVTEYNCRETIVEKNAFGYLITYQNSTTAIRISYEPRECAVFILLSRIINGEIPKYPIFIKPETIINCFYLDDIIKLKVPSARNESIGKYLLSKNDVEIVIQKNANYLKQYATDILNGDFNLFDELDKIVKGRSAKEKP